MPVYEYHTLRDDLYGSDERRVYHNKLNCPDGKRIHPRYREDGRGVGRSLCKECPKVA